MKSPSGVILLTCFLLVFPAFWAQAPRPEGPSATGKVRISAAEAVGLLLQKTQPSYPPIAKAAHISGTVVLQATISKTGSIEEPQVISGPAMLQQAALDAVRQWRYKPYFINNRPVEVETTINVIFTLGADTPQSLNTVTKPTANDSGPSLAETDHTGVFISLLEQNWNWQSHWRVFLGPTYFGSGTSFGRGLMGTHRYALAATSEYPVFRSLASKGLITLSKLSIADAPASPAGVNANIDFGAIVTLTEAGARSGKVDEKEHNVTFAFGTYGVEKITSNTGVRIGEDDYRLVEGTYVLNIAPEFDDVWAERSWPRQRDFQFRALFKYDSDESKWEIADASAGYGQRAMDTGPRDGNFESEKVPQTVNQLQTLNQLRSTPSGATSRAPFFGVWDQPGFHGGYFKVIISGSAEKPRVHLWAACSPHDCDKGEEDAVWDGSTLTSTFRQDGGPTVFRFTLDQNANLQLNCHYSGGDCATMHYTRSSEQVAGGDNTATPEGSPTTTTPADYFGVWNKSGSRGGYVKVIISGGPEKPRVHIWGACNPQDCDDGEEDAFLDGSALTSTFQTRDGYVIKYRFTLDQNRNLQLNCHSISPNGKEWDCVTMSYTK